MRSISSLKSVITSFAANSCNILFAFVLQKIITKNLGVEYVGLNSVFLNIIALLSVADLGIGVAISCHLYEPLKNNDTEKIKTLLKFYNKCFNVIAFVILILGIAVIPFLNFIVNQNEINGNITIYYLIYLIDTVLSYLLMYKRSIIQADQKAYVINIIHLFCILIMNSLQIIFLILMKSYIVYLCLKVVFRLIENLIISYKANQLYPYLKDNNVKKIDSNTKNDIIKKVKALLFHKIGGFVVNSSDNLIITKILGLTVTGIYSYYSLIVNSLNSLFYQIFTSITGSLGNLIVEKSPEKSYIVYKRLLFFNAWTYMFFVSAYFSIIRPFITIWVGEQYLLDVSVLVIIVINFYLQGIRNTVNLFKDASGIFYEDRFMPIVEVIINLVVSIVCAIKFGLAGVLIGTIVSTLVVCIYGYPKYIYTPLFKKSRSCFLREHFKYFALAAIDLIVSYIIISLFHVNNSLLQCIVNGFIVVIIPNLINIICLRKTDEFIYYKKFLINIILKFQKR